MGEKIVMPKKPWLIIQRSDSPKPMRIDYERVKWLFVDVGYVMEIFFKKENRTRSYWVTDIKNYLYTRGYMLYNLELFHTKYHYYE